MIKVHSSDLNRFRFISKSSTRTILHVKWHIKMTSIISPFRKLNTFSLRAWDKRKTEKVLFLLSYLVNTKCALQRLSKLKTTFDYFFSLQIDLPLIGAVATIVRNGRSTQHMKLKQIKLQLKGWNAFIQRILRHCHLLQLIEKTNIKTYSFIVDFGPQLCPLLVSQSAVGLLCTAALSWFFTFNYRFWPDVSDWVAVKDYFCV